MNLPAIISEEIQVKIQTFYAKAESYKIPVKSEMSSINAGHALTDLKGHMKDLEALRKSLTKPLDDEKKSIMDAFREPESRLKDAEGFLKDQLLAWEKAKREELARQQRELEEKAREQEVKAKAILEAQKKAAEDDWDFDLSETIEKEKETLIVPVPILEAKKNLTHGLSTSVTYYAEVVDPDLVPRAFLIVDQKSLDELARKTKGQAEVPGVKFVEHEYMSARAARR